MRAFLSALFGVVLRIFFRRIEMVGEERIPRDGPVVFVLNHPNALIDPAFMLCFAPRPVSFLAKSTLFSMPVVGSLVKGFDCLPVYRRSDKGADPSKNRETFTKARELLGRGGSIALFPEGTSHSDPKMRPLKTGAARIALGAAARDEQGRAPQKRLRIVPAGLYYTEKTKFRSRALVYYGEPFEVDVLDLDESGEPPRKDTLSLTAQISEALNEITLQADRNEALQLVQRAESIFSASNRDPLLSSFELQQRFIKGYHALKETHLERLESLDERIRRLQKECDLMGIRASHLTEADFHPKKVLSRSLGYVLTLLLLLPLAVLGVLVHLAPYHLVDLVARRFSKEEIDMTSTIKILAALLFFPLTWTLVAVLVGVWIDWSASPLAWALTGVSGYAALLFRERMERAMAACHALLAFVIRRSRFEAMRAEQKAIYEEVLALGDLMTTA